MSRLIRGVLTAAGLVKLLSVPILAHHGFGTFDLEGKLELDGVITGVDFVNPHAWVYLDVVNSEGEIEAWRCEMRAATVLKRSGWSKQMFVEGEPIYITGAPDKSDSRSCYMSHVVFADGSSADRYGQLKQSTPIQKAKERPLRLSNGDLNISGDWAPEQFVMADPRGISGGLVPLSVAQGEAEAGEGARPWGSSRVSFTAEGQAAADAFDMRSVNDNPRMRCETTSIIFDWDFDGPINRITQHEDSISLHYGRYGFARIIHMNMEGHPDNLPLSRAGHSIGRWENDVLIVDTVGFAPGWLSPPVANSDQLHVIERFSLDVENFVLKRDYEAVDPLIYTDRYVGSNSLNIADVPYSPDECKELTFVDFDSQVEAEPNVVEGEAPEAASPWWKFWD